MFCIIEIGNLGARSLMGVAWNGLGWRMDVYSIAYDGWQIRNFFCSAPFPAWNDFAYLMRCLFYYVLSAFRTRSSQFATRSFLFLQTRVVAFSSPAVRFVFALKRLTVF